MLINNRFIAIAVLGVLSATGLFAQPAHFTDANQLVTDLLSDRQNVNIYDADGSLTDSIDWTGSPRTAISVCGSFITLLMKHTYGFTNNQYTAKTGSRSPNAATYHDAIVAQSGFTRITMVDQIQPGDVIAVKYPAGGNSSGHVMLAQTIGAYQDRSNSTQNFLANRAQPDVAGYYNVAVIDSSASFHGPNDTRANKPGGIGRNGVVRIFVNSSFQITGYTWSTINSSEYRKPADGYTLAIGRLNQAAW